MANTITGWNTFVAGTKIRSNPMNTNLSNLKNMSTMWQKYTVAYTSWSALGATATGAVTLWSISADEVVDAYAIKHSAAFSGTSITAAVVRLGKTGDDSAYTDDFSVFAAPSSTNNQLTETLACEFSTTSFIVTLSLTGGLLSQLSAGSLDIYVRRSIIPSS